MSLLTIFISFIFLLLKVCQSEILTCRSHVFCTGDLLHAVQLSGIFNDSKTFVDMKLLHSETETLNNFAMLKSDTHSNPTKEDIELFIKKNFDGVNGIEAYAPPDFNSRPWFINEIPNKRIQTFCYNMVQLWPSISKRISDEVRRNEERHSYIIVPNPFIVPGGRYREYYYWDSYWIIDGLLVSGMVETAKGMLDNFMYLVKKFGYVPNGGRIYYLGRSQPPLLVSMAHLYFQHTKNTAWLKQNIDTLAKELQHWDTHTVTVGSRRSQKVIARYSCALIQPRPENYADDIKTGSIFQAKGQLQNLYMDLSSAAESGWGFSSRWNVNEQCGGNTSNNRNGNYTMGGNYTIDGNYTKRDSQEDSEEENFPANQNLHCIQTRRILPVDLNAYLCGAYRDLSELYASLNDVSNSRKWKRRYEKRRDAIKKVFWNGKDGMWYDYDYKQQQPRNAFHPSAIAPLWTKCFRPTDQRQLGPQVMKYLERSGLFDYLKGITSPQGKWDFPRDWPPLIHMLVKGLENTGYDKAIAKARDLATDWVLKSVKEYEINKMLWAQYQMGHSYDKVQGGFAWANGVGLRFVYDYFFQK